MKLYMKQQFFSFRTKFDIYDIDQNPVYYVEGTLFTLSKQRFIYDVATGQELAYFKQELFHLFPTFDVYASGEFVATIKKEFSFFKPRYVLQGSDWSIEGDFFAHNYHIIDGTGQVIATISKKWLAWFDTFEFDINDALVNPVAVIAVILAIDAVMDSNSSS